VARKTNEPVIEVKQFTRDELLRAISQLRRRIGDIEALQQEAPNHSDGRIDALESNIRTTILELYGSRSPEFNEHQYFEIPFGPIWFDMSNHDHQNRLSQGYPRALEKLRGMLGRLNEKL